MTQQSGTLARPQPRDRRLDPRRTAILVVDVQNAEVTEEVRREKADFHRAVIERALPAQKRLFDAARARGAEIVYTVIEALTADGRDRSLDHKLSGILIPKGSGLAKVIDAVAPEDG